MIRNGSPTRTRDPARLSTELELQLSLEQVVDRKTQELEAERERLSKALEALHATQGQLVQAQKLESIGQLAAGIAHEINTPAQYVTDNVGFVRHASTLLLTLVDRLMPLLEAARSGGRQTELVAAADAALKRTKLDYLREQLPEALDQSLEGLGRIAKIVSAMKEFSHPRSARRSRSSCANSSTPRSPLRATNGNTLPPSTPPSTTRFRRCRACAT